MNIPTMTAEEADKFTNDLKTWSIALLVNRQNELTYNGWWISYSSEVIAELEQVDKWITEIIESVDHTDTIVNSKQI